MSALVELGVENATSEFIATRGSRLVLRRFCDWGRGQRAEEFHVEVLDIVEIDADERIVRHISFDPDDFDAAIAELDARYLAGEAAAHSHTWSLIAAAFAAVNRHELPELTPDWVNIDHRRAASFAAGDMTAYIHDLWDDAQDITVYIEAVHRLNSLGAVVTQGAHGTSQQGFEAEWREIGIFTFDGDLLSRFELFDEADLDAALAKFEQLSRPAPRLENAASRATDRYLERLVAHDWDALAEMLADDYYTDDRRHVVGGGIYGRDAEIASVQMQANLGVTHITWTVMAVRGERLALSRARYSGRDQALEVFLAEMLIVFEINADDRFAAAVAFDIDHIDAAFEELDARYLAGEAAAHSHTWSVIMRSFAAVNRHEVPATTRDWAMVDHRPLATFETGDLAAFLHAAWDLTPDLSMYVEEVHRLSDLGAVVTYAGHATSQEGLDAEWHDINLATVDGDLIARNEIFDEADIDAALARFEELHPRARRLENAASQVTERFLAHFAAGDWDAMAEILADNFSRDDRRRVVGAGVRHGRDAWLVDMRATADLWITNVASTVVATRGGRLVLMRGRYFSDRDEVPEAYLTEFVGIVEISADERIVALVMFDLDDIDAAFEELDARYLAGEAAPYARVWQLGMDTIGELNRHEPGPMIGRLVYADHRRVPFASGDEFRRGVQELWALVPDARYRTQAVHALDAHGTVATLVIEGTDAHGNELQWGRTILFGSEEPRVEAYEEDDVDAALARFEELRSRLENTASQVSKRFGASLAVRDWNAIAEMLSDATFTDDRRRVVNAGLRLGRNAVIFDLQTIADLGAAKTASTVLAIRGERLVLNKVRVLGRDQQPAQYDAEVLIMIEIDPDNRLAALIAFDLDDVNAAFEELDARYLAGEAAAYSQTWSAIAQTYSAFNRRELPAADWVNIDRRRGTPFDSSDLTASIRDSLDLTPDLSIYIEAVHRLNGFAAVLTNKSYGTSQEGFDAEWRMIQLLTVEGDRINRCELFDEADLDTAIARFEGLHPQAPRLENAASRLIERFLAHFATRNWAAMTELVADDTSTYDRRRVVNAENQHGRDADIANLRAMADLGVKNIASTLIATRGDRLALSRVRMSGRDHRPDAFRTEALAIAEIDADNRIAARVVFDLDDSDAAFEELDARYLAGEAAAQSQTWSVITGIYAAFNRHELSATTPDWVNTDHRRGIAFAPGEMTAYIRAGTDLTPDTRIHIETVHRLSNVGVVVTQVMKGTSRDGFDAEWREIGILTVEGGLISCCEMFDEADVDAALARFDELSVKSQPK
jgi:hypothetical protein